MSALKDLQGYETKELLEARKEDKILHSAGFTHKEQTELDQFSDQTWWDLSAASDPSTLRAICLALDVSKFVHWVLRAIVTSTFFCLGFTLADSTVEVSYDIRHGRTDKRQHSVAACKSTLRPCSTVTPSETFPLLQVNILKSSESRLYFRPRELIYSKVAQKWYVPSLGVTPPSVWLQQSGALPLNFFPYNVTYVYSNLN